MKNVHICEFQLERFWGRFWFRLFGYGLIIYWPVVLRPRKLPASPASFKCQKCGADRLQPGCGDSIYCPMIGKAASGTPTVPNVGEKP